MLKNLTVRPQEVVGPLGYALSLDDLPPPDTQRWIPRRKAEVVSAVEGGLITIEEACERYNLSSEELLSWEIAITRDGLAGLRATKVQQYRDQTMGRRHH